ncbi:MAG: Dihydrofolate reductase type 3 [Gammaproteobacteria bacterium]|nr:Dihydrofolate reductase type 3 [Gammaproteobacteria bacterium]
MTRPEIAIVVAMDRNHVIGREGGLPWHLPGDLQHFKRLTMGRPIIMGRRTHASLGRPLPGRDNIVVTGNPAYLAPGCSIARSLEEAMSLADDAPMACVIGGAALYREALPLANRIYLTEVHAVARGDVRFPRFDRARWREVAREYHSADERNPHAHSFVELVRTV